MHCSALAHSRPVPIDPVRTKRKDAGHVLRKKRLGGIVLVRGAALRGRERTPPRAARMKLDQILWADPLARFGPRPHWRARCAGGRSQLHRWCPRCSPYGRPIRGVNGMNRCDEVSCIGVRASVTSGRRMASLETGSPSGVGSARANVLRGDQCGQVHSGLQCCEVGARCPLAPVRRNARAAAPVPGLPWCTRHGDDVR